MTNGVEWQTELVRNAARRLSYAATEMGHQAETIAAAGRLIGKCLGAGGKVLVAGNGGSAACAQHFAAEFTGKLALDRGPLSAIALTVDTSAMTAIANDYSYDNVFARQVQAHGRPGDVFVGLSTSGYSSNVASAVKMAKEAGLLTVVLTGPHNAMGGDIEIKVAVGETSRIQEVHDLVLHELAQLSERLVFETLGDDASADRYPFELSLGHLEGFRQWMEFSGQQLVTTNGVFDLLHEGHLSSLRQARRHGDRLVVLVNSDDSVRRIKGDSRPIDPIERRLRNLARTGLVDHVVVLVEDAPVLLLGELRPAVHCKGEEYANRSLPEREIVESRGGRIELLRLEAGLSTSSLVERISR